MNDDNRNTDKLCVSFYKDGVSIDVVVMPLRYDEAISIAKVDIGFKMLALGIANIDKFLDSASATISTVRTFD